MQVVVTAPATLLQGSKAFGKQWAVGPSYRSLLPCTTEALQHGFRGSGDRGSRIQSAYNLTQAPYGVWAASQPWIPTGEQSGLQTHTVTTGSGSLCEPLKSSLRFWNWNGRFVSTYWLNNADAPRCDSKRFVVRADETLTAFMDPED